MLEKVCGEGTVSVWRITPGLTSVRSHALGDKIRPLWWKQPNFPHCLLLSPPHTRVPGMFLEGLAEFGTGVALLRRGGSFRSREDLVKGF